jgi:hypothetical protein
MRCVIVHRPYLVNLVVLVGHENKREAENILQLFAVEMSKVIL